MQQLLQSASGRSYALDVVVGLRSSPDMRGAARPSLDKDVRSLAAASSREGADPQLLLAAAEEALRRMADPPEGWT
jgi:hypothetical protein